MSYAAVEEDGTIGLVIEVFDDLDQVCADVVLLRGCPQSCMPNPVEDLLEVYEDMIKILMVLVIYLTTVESDRDVFFNIFLKRIMTDALEDHEGTVSIGDRTITSLRFANDIDGLAEEKEMATLVECLDKLPRPVELRSVPGRPSCDKQHQWH